VIRLLFIFPLLIASGCASVEQWIGADASVEESASMPEEVPDGPPLIASIDVASIPEPKAQPEPLAQYGNPESYEVDDVTYRVEPVGAGFAELGTASWYGRKFHGQLTSSGEPFDMFQFTAAHKTMPIPAWIRVTNVENDQSLIVRVNDRGPFKEDRVLDLSWAAAERLGFADQGIAKVRYEVLTVPISDAALIANPLAKPAQAIFQVAALSTEIQAQKVAEQIRLAMPEEQASVRVESNGAGLFRVQILPITDLGIERAIYEQLVDMGWSPQRLIGK
jgi:rare lipoprotein A